MYMAIYFIHSYYKYTNFEINQQYDTLWSYITNIYARFVIIRKRTKCNIIQTFTNFAVQIVIKKKSHTRPYFKLNTIFV